MFRNLEKYAYNSDRKGTDDEMKKKKLGYWKLIMSLFIVIHQIEIHQ